MPEDNQVQLALYPVDDEVPRPVRSEHPPDHFGLDGAEWWRSADENPWPGDCAWHQAWTEYQRQLVAGVDRRTALASYHAACEAAGDEEYREQFELRRDEGEDDGDCRGLRTDGDDQAGCEL